MITGHQVACDLELVLLWARFLFPKGEGGFHPLSCEFLAGFQLYRHLLSLVQMPTVRSKGYVPPRIGQCSAAMSPHSQRTRSGAPALGFCPVCVLGIRETFLLSAPLPPLPHAGVTPLAILQLSAGSSGQINISERQEELNHFLTTKPAHRLLPKNMPLNSMLMNRLKTAPLPSRPDT